MGSPSVRAQVITRRTYSRPLAGGTFETWEQTVDRCIRHQAVLWRRAKGSALNASNQFELEQLRGLMLNRVALLAGRTLWLGGTTQSYRVEACQFNCSFTKVETANDLVDMEWLLLNGCGVGFMPTKGTLNGFCKHHIIEVIRSTRTTKGGQEETTDRYDPRTKTWTLKIGDSARAWARSIGKLFTWKHPDCNRVIIDLSAIRPPGDRLAGYGWISSGDKTLAIAMVKLCEILNRQAGALLSCVDILDVCNWLGTILSTRRSAEIALLEFDNPEVESFILAKKDYWVSNPQRAQSNNSVMFTRKPTEEELQRVFKAMAEAGGSEPGFINGEEAKARAPWFNGVNPCAEILLGNKSFCNLTEVDASKFANTKLLEEAIRLMARANFRQTLVNLDDGVLQKAWNENNQFLHLCGVSITGLMNRETPLSPYELKDLRNCAILGAYSMADELNKSRPKNVTTVKPSGTLSKIMDTTEGIHKPLGRYIFNNVAFSRYDELIPPLRQAGYHIIEKPGDADTLLVRFPVEWPKVKFDIVDGKEVNLDSAVMQLDRYKEVMLHYVEQNCSVTVSYSPEEVPGIIEWLLANWDSYVGVSFLYRADPTKTAKDLGYPYLPQEVVTREVFQEYTKGLLPMSIHGADKGEIREIADQSDCAGGACPIR